MISFLITLFFCHPTVLMSLKLLIRFENLILVEEFCGAMEDQ